MANPPAHRPDILTPQQIERQRLVREDWPLFFDHLSLVLNHERDILACDQYFFCRPSFAWCGLSYEAGPTMLGTLLLGWRTGLLIDVCTKEQGERKAKYCCIGQSYVTGFGGTAGSPGWTGFCTVCGGSKFVYDDSQVMERVGFANAVKEQCRDWAEGLELEHFRSQKFSWAHPGIVPTTGARMVRTKQPLIQAVTVAELIQELKAGNIRLPTPKGRSLLPETLLYKHNDSKVVESIRLVE